MLIVIIVIIGLSFLILAHEAGHFIVAKLFKMDVEEFGFGFPPRIAAKKIGATEYSLNWLPFGGFVRIAGENDQFDEDKDGAAVAQLPPEEKKGIFSFQPVWKRSLVFLAGVAINFIVGWLLLSFVLIHGTPSLIVINSVEANSPAQTAGLMSNDIIKNYADAQSFITFIDEHKGTPISFEVNRNGADVTIHVTPRAAPTANEGALGVELSDAGVPKQGFFVALWLGLKEAGSITVLTIQGFWGLIKTLVLHASLEAGVVGPVGIFSVAQQTGSLGLIYLVQLISLISINLAVVNLIPFPALDGGRFLFVIIEKIKGSPLPRRVEAWVNTVGFALLILLMVLLTVRDVTRLF